MSAACPIRLTAGASSSSSYRSGWPDCRATMARVGDKSASEIGQYSEAELAVIDDFLTRMAAITARGGDCAPGIHRPSERPWIGARRAHRRAGAGTPPVQVGCPRAPAPRRARYRGPVPREVRRVGPASPTARRDRHDPVQGQLVHERRALLRQLAAGLERATRRRLAQRRDPVGRRGQRRGRQAARQVRRAGPPLVRAVGRGRSAPADAWPADRRRPHPADPGREQRPGRATDRGPRPAHAARRRRPDRLRPAAARMARATRSWNRRAPRMRPTATWSTSWAAPAGSPSPRRSDSACGRGRGVRRPAPGGRGGRGTRRGSGRGSGTGPGRRTWS